MNHQTDPDAVGAASATPSPAANEQAAPAGAAPANDLPQDLPGAYRKLLAEKQDLYDRLLRKQAELENVKKRTEREKEDFLKHATADLVRALLPALDSFERALKHRDPRVPADFYKGVELIHREFVEVLKRAGLEPIETKSALFDPHLHQAVERVESRDHRDQEIVEELQRGYKLKSRLLRPAIVKVAVPPSPGSIRGE
ncbi:MAG TPA: nucleotide exchange factor GrpE [Terriglobia bacterium]|nr:nucleotide exchange factor GrpE [Terriglobia bacterium]